MVGLSEIDYFGDEILGDEDVVGRQVHVHDAEFLQEEESPREVDQQVHFGAEEEGLGVFLEEEGEGEGVLEVVHQEMLPIGESALDGVVVFHEIGRAGSPKVLHHLLLVGYLHAPLQGQLHSYGLGQIDWLHLSFLQFEFLLELAPGSALHNWVFGVDVGDFNVSQFDHTVVAAERRRTQLHFLLVFDEDGVEQVEILPVGQFSRSQASGLPHKPRF